MLTLAAAQDPTSAASTVTAQQALPYVVVAFVFFAIVLWFVLAQSSATGSAVSHALWGSPFALFIFCVLSAVGLAWGLPTVYKKMELNPFNLQYSHWGLWSGIVVGVLFFAVMLRRILRMRRQRRWRGW